jgi:hypothetical protein
MLSVPWTVEPSICVSAFGLLPSNAHCLEDMKRIRYGAIEVQL